MNTTSQGVSPTSAEVEAAILRLQERFPQWVNVLRICDTSQGRPVYAVTVTDSQADDDQKQHALVLASQHGDEESSRMIALALLEWLTTEEAQPIRTAQKIVVMPNINPDGTEADTYHNAQDIQLNADHAPSGPLSIEAKAVEEVACALQPEMVVDLHARGKAGCSYDMVMYSWTRPYTEDGRIVQAIAEEMAAAGEAARMPEAPGMPGMPGMPGVPGIPHVVHSLIWPGWHGDIPAAQSSHTLAFMYHHFKSLCLLTETAESNTIAPPAELRTNVGLARLKTLLAHGQRRHQSLYYSGYPVSPVTNMFHRGLVAAGVTAAQRRRSRLAIWRNADHFRRFDGEIPEHPHHKSFQCAYDGEPITEGVGFQLRCGGHWQTINVQLNHQTLGMSEADGFVTWRDGCSTFIVVNQPSLQPGTFDIQVTLE